MFKFLFPPTKFWLLSRKSNNLSKKGIHTLKLLGTLVSKCQQGPGDN